jgi:Fungal specific transcription factor domain/Fungal Zn(2)-Cys(6) binuclear cluster domain
MPAASRDTPPAGRQRPRCSHACDNCKRRKEKCDGQQPCGRCVTRGYQYECRFSEGPVPRRAQVAARRLNRLDSNQDVIISTNLESIDSSSRVRRISDNDDTQTAEVPQLSRLIRDPKGGYMYIGDSGNLSFLHIIRRFVTRSIGSCALVDDPLRHNMVEAAPNDQSDWSRGISEPLKPSLLQAKRLIQSFFTSTNGVLDLFDEDVFENISEWLENASSGEPQLPSSIYFLVFAIGAQTCSEEDLDVAAESYFSYGRYLTATTFMEEPSILIIQLTVLISMFLLGAARRNGAFMYLGIAVRAAYALGLHLEEVARKFTAQEYRTRERLWKGIRVLDLFMSASLGRPPSTSNTRLSKDPDNYSPSLELRFIFERILTDIYSRRMITSEVLKQISGRQREWTARLSGALTADLNPETAGSQAGDLSVGVVHLKGDFYWSVILLTRPYLIEAVSVRATTSFATYNSTNTSDPPIPNRILVYACVDSAIRAIELVNGLVESGRCPKRLPFVVNTVFASALVVGFAFFCDLDLVFSLSTHLAMATSLLRHFAADKLAKRFLTIIENLQNACQSHVDKRARASAVQRGRLVEDIFGSIQNAGSPLIFTESPIPENLVSTRQTLRRAGNILTPIGNGEALIPGQDSSSTRFNDLNYAEADADIASTVIGFEQPGRGMMELSPHTLWFDSFDDNQLIYPTVGTNFVGLE